MKSTAHNGRFHASGGVCPQEHLCKFASASLARTFVPPRLREAAGTLGAMVGQSQRKTLNIVEILTKKSMYYEKKLFKNQCNCDFIINRNY